MAVVPNVVGMTNTDAYNALSAAGLTGQLVGSLNQTPYHIIFSQSPAAGATVTDGSNVEMVIRDNANGYASDGVVWGT